MMVTTEYVGTEVGTDDYGTITKVVDLIVIAVVILGTSVAGTITG
jgi:hypothetical protein